MDLQSYTQERGIAAKLARAIGVTPVLISQWATGARPVPEDRAPALEAATGFAVLVEEMCPSARWVRVADPQWPKGKPLLDKTPEATEEAKAAA